MSRMFLSRQCLCLSKQLAGCLVVTVTQVNAGQKLEIVDYVDCVVGGFARFKGGAYVGYGLVVKVKLCKQPTILA